MKQTAMTKCRSAGYYNMLPIFISKNGLILKNQVLLSSLVSKAPASSTNLAPGVPTTYSMTSIRQFGVTSLQSCAVVLISLFLRTC